MPDSSAPDYFASAGQQYGMDPDLLRAVAQVESGGTRDPTHAASYQGAQGRMQFLPATAKEMGITDTSDDSQVIPGAARYLLQGYQATGTPEGAVMYYHGGPDQSIWGPKTHAYVGKVTAAYQALKARSGVPAPVQMASADTGYATDASPAPETPQFTVFGDSLGQGIRDAGKLPGTSKVGASPWDVLQQIKSAPADGVQGRTVVLSSGTSNNPQALDLVKEQVAQLYAKGAAEVRLVGVGSRPDLAPMNDDLAKIAKSTGATFLGPVDAGKDGVHPRDYRTLTAAATKAGSAAPPGGDDYLTKTWGVGGKAAPSGADEAPDDYLTKTWGVGKAATVPGVPPVPTAPPPAAVPAVPAPASPSFATPGTPATGLPAKPLAGAPTPTSDAVGAGMLHGVHEMLDKPAEFLARHLGGTNDQTAARNAAGAAQYQKDYGDNPLANAASVGIKIAGSLLPAAAAGRLVEGAASLAPGANTLVGRLLTSSASGAAQGATAAAATGQPIAEGAATGGALGAALPAVAGVARYGMNAAQSGADYLLGGAGAADRTARAAIDRFAGHTPTVPANPLLVPGSAPTLAEATGNTGVARLQAGVAADPVLGGMFNARNASNATARVAALERAAGDDHALQAAIDARGKITPDFTAKHAIDPSPVIHAIQSELDGPGGGELALRSKLEQIKGLLTDRHGNPLPQASDPEYLYQSVRKSLGNVMSGLDPNGQRGAVASNVLRVLNQNIQPVLDHTIEAGAPGFRQYLSSYSAASRPIDAMKFLQGLNLTDSQGRITLAKVQSALDKVDTANSARTRGISAAQSVDGGQYDALRAIRDDLMRTAQANDGVRAVGSNTVQNLATQHVLGSTVGGPLGAVAARIPARLALTALGYAGGHAAGMGELGSVAAGGAGELLGAGMSGMAAARNDAARNRLAELLLNPSIFGAGPRAGVVQTLGNPLLTALNSVRPALPGAIVAGKGQSATVGQ